MAILMEPAAGLKQENSRVLLLFTTEVRTDITANAIDEILIEIDSIKEKLISDSRLNEVKNYIIGSFPDEFTK